MEDLTLNIATMNAEQQNRQIQEAVRKNRQRLLEFIRRRIPPQEDAEDVLQEVFYELVEMYRLMKPVEQLASWLFTVARNKITDLYRKKKPVSLEEHFSVASSEEDEYLLADVLPATQVNSEDKIMQRAILDALAEALEELPAEQRDVFVWHELEGKSFKEIATLTGVTQNTLLSRKRYAILYLRERLRFLYDDLVQ
ncbi:MAG: sigma-70 family RNA polymerase sigma factor [Spirosomataceae bacterium]